MDIKDYNRMVRVTDKAKDVIDDEQSEAILNTMQSAFEIIENYCKKSIPNFEVFGRVTSKIYSSDSEISQDIDIIYNNKPLEKSEQAKHVDIINQLLMDSYNDIGWEAE